VLVERHHLAVDDRVGRADPGGAGGCQLGEVVGGVVVIAGPQPDRAVRHDGLDPVPVELHLEQPVVVAERGVDRGREHRRDEAGEGSLDRAREVDERFRGRLAGVPDGRHAILHLVVGAP